MTLKTYTTATKVTNTMQYPFQFQRKQIGLFTGVLCGRGSLSLMRFAPRAVVFFRGKGWGSEGLGIKVTARHWFWGYMAAGVVQWYSLWFNGREGEVEHESSTKIIYDIILLSSNKQTDGRSQVSDDDSLIRVTNTNPIGSFVRKHREKHTPSKPFITLRPVRLLYMFSNWKASRHCPKHYPTKQEMPEYLCMSTRTKSTVDKSNTKDWGSDTQELKWEQRRVRDSENELKGKLNNKKPNSKRRQELNSRAR